MFIRAVHDDNSGGGFDDGDDHHHHCDDQHAPCPPSYRRTPILAAGSVCVPYYLYQHITCLYLCIKSIK